MWKQRTSCAGRVYYTYCLRVGCWYTPKNHGIKARFYESRKCLIYDQYLRGKISNHGFTTNFHYVRQSGMASLLMLRIQFFSFLINRPTSSCLLINRSWGVKWMTKVHVNVGNTRNRKQTSFCSGVQVIFVIVVEWKTNDRIPPTTEKKNFTTNNVYRKVNGKKVRG